MDWEKSLIEVSAKVKLYRKLNNINIIKPFDRRKVLDFLTECYIDIIEKFFKRVLESEIIVSKGNLQFTYISSEVLKNSLILTYDSNGITISGILIEDTNYNFNIASKEQFKMFILSMIVDSDTIEKLKKW